ncbi:MAG: hypothetical protein P9L99_11650 [Candidatus Lernaella stagnicola]|nr:hypothetical protein [Candidatus Lernaella stagnicola]
MKRWVPAALLLLLFSVLASAGRHEAESLNTEGFQLYKQGRYGDAAVVFRRAVAADETYGLAHYNLACTLALLRRQREVCEHDTYRGTITQHLADTLKYLPEKRSKMLTDPDLRSIHDTLFFQNLRGLSPKRDKDVREILVGVQWWGPSPGAYGPVAGVDFQSNGTFRFWALEMGDTVERRKFAGRFEVKGRKVILQFKQPFHGKKKLIGVLRKNGVLFFESVDWRMTDEPDECSA